MIGVTIGIGPDWEPIARRSAEIMSNMTGLQCRVIASCDNLRPSWAKCLVTELFPQENEFLVFDADIVCLKSWKPAVLFDTMGRRFCAVPEPKSEPVLNECKTYRIPFPDWYVNGGLTLFGREHRPVWRRTLERHPSFGSWEEQTALNLALKETGVEMARLPRIYNALAHHGELLPDYAGCRMEEIVNIHYCSIGVPSVLSVLQSREAIDKTELHITVHQLTRLDLLQSLPRGGICAELGVFAGEFSGMILAIVKPDVLHLVDLYAGSIVSGDENGNNMRRLDMAAQLSVIADLFKDTAASPIRAASWAWLERQEPHSIDWVYIDTDHTESTTARELAAARRAVKVGGFICGHDYSPRFPSVIIAVNAFAQQHGLTIELFTGDKIPSYKIRNDR